MQNSSGSLGMDNYQKLTSRSNNPIGTRVKLMNIEFGGSGIVIIAGPCSIENENSYHRRGRLHRFNFDSLIAAEGV